ncbi:MAG TPA: hypothetical protein VFO86_07245, partial [Terriglobia bacterium]|nr:hypothetical protein [Terriglobia bacterium]
RTKEDGQYFQRLHALDVTTGAEKFGGSVVIQASIAGSGYDAVNGQIDFNSLRENQRPGLALSNGKVYIAWASHGDYDPYHGWLMAYDAATLAQVAVFNTTPDGGRGGIWQSGQAPAIDGNGNLILATGNGDWDGTRNFGTTILKLDPLLSVLDWFTPDNYSFLNDQDYDLGTSGVLMIPDSNKVLVGGKTGTLYLAPQDNLGHLQPGNPQIQEFQNALNGHDHGSPVYWADPTYGPTVFVWSENDYLKAFHFNGSTLDTSPVRTSSFTAVAGMPGGILSISANGNAAGSGVVWVSMPLIGDAELHTVPGIFRAFDASDLSTELWDSGQDPSDDSGNFAKFSPP